MQYIKLAELYEKLGSTSKRLEKTYYISKLLEKASSTDLVELMLLLQGRVFPSWDQRKIGFGGRMVLKAISIATGADVKKVESKFKSIGDLGLVAEQLTGKKSQATLFSTQLTVKKVYDNIRKLAEMMGAGTVTRKQQLVSELLTSAKPIEAKYIVRTVLEELRVGVGEGSIRDGMVWAWFPKVIGIFFTCSECGTVNPGSTKCMECGEKLDTKFKNEISKKYKGKILEPSNIDDVIKAKLDTYDFVLTSNEKLARQIYDRFVNLVQKALDVSNDFSVVAKTIKEHGIRQLVQIELATATPIKVMLAQKVSTIKEGFEKVGVPCAIEQKYDGFRIQIHKSHGKILLYTRRLEDVTKQFPEVVKYIKEHVKAENFILDSEAVGYDSKTGKYMPFQSISQRIKRKYDIDKIALQLPVELNIFDVVSLNGKNVLGLSFKERRKLLEGIVKPVKKKIRLAEQLVTDNEEQAMEFYNKSLEQGNEGIILKNLESPYKPGSRVGYMIKMKPTMETLDLVVVGAEWGEGKRSKWLSSFILACLDHDTGEFLEVGRVGTGFKEKAEEGLSFEEMTTLLKPAIISEKGKVVRVNPSVVIEVTYEEIQKSPGYSSGYALRFPRVVQLRTDRGPQDISTIDMIEDFFYDQKKKK